MVHLVYCDNKEKVLKKILDGTKTMIIGGAAGRKILHSRVFENETLYFMEKGSKKISAAATVKNVQNFVKLTDSEIKDILKKIRISLIYLKSKRKDGIKNVSAL